jgi:sugar lactone lactonase YvrE
MMSGRRTAVVLGALLLTCGAAHAGDAPALKIINKAVAFPEGPIYKGNILYYVGYGGTGVISWDGRQNKVIFSEKTCGPNSVTNFGDDLLVACYDGNALIHIKTDGTVVGRADKASNGSAIVGPNDFASDGKGGLYATASGPWETGPIVGKVFHVSADLKVTELADDLHYANGVVLTADGKRLLVGESEAQRIISFAVNADGTLSDRRLFLRLNKIDPEAGVDAFPDGIKIGPDGNLWIGQYSRSRITVVSPDGSTFIKGYDLPGQACPNVAFTPDGKSLIAMVVDDKSGAPWPGTIYEMSIQ